MGKRPIHLARQAVWRLGSLLLSSVDPFRYKFAVIMLGHGRPPLIRLSATLRSSASSWWLSVPLALVALWVNGAAVANAAEKTLSGTASSNADETADADDRTEVQYQSIPDEQAIPDQQAIQDQSTAPFQVRFPSSNWPIVTGGQKGNLTVRVHEFNKYSGRTLQLQVRLYRVEDGTLLRREQTEVRLDSQGNCPEIVVANEAPDQEGVYEIQCRLIEEPEKLWAKITGDKNEVAIVALPWLIESKDPNVPEELAEPSGWAWEPVGSAERKDPENGDAPWSFAPWPTTSRAAADSDSSKVAFLGQLPELTPHQLYRVTVTLKQAADQEPAERVSDRAPSGGDPRLEFSEAIDFKNLIRSQVLETFQEQNFTVDESEELYRFDTLYYPSTDRDYVRIAAEFFPKQLEVVSVKVDRPVEATTPADAPVRAYALELEQLDWADDITGDFARELSSRGFCAATSRLYRLYRAQERLGHYARWLGFSQVIVPLDSRSRILFSHPSIDLGNEVGTRSSASARFADANTFAALARWMRSSNVRLVAKLRGEFRFLPPSPAGDSLSSLDPLARRQLENCLADLSKWHRNGEYFDGFAIEGREADAFRETLNPEFRYPLLQSIADGEVQRLVIGWESLSGSVSRRCVDLLQEYRHLPVGRVASLAVRRPGSTTVESATDYVTVSTDATGVTLINHAPWSSDVTLQFTLPSERTDGEPNQELHWMLRSHERDALNVRAGNRSNECIVRLRPLEMLGLKATFDDVADDSAGKPSPSAKLRSYRVAVVGGQPTIRAIKARVGEVVAKIGNLSQPFDYEALRNGSFEQKGKVGIVGWMHTQFPDTAVMLDSEEAIEGTNSIRMTTSEKSAGRTWLVSSPIVVPASGRLAVSLATRSSVPTQQRPAAKPLAGRKRNPFAQVTRVDELGEKKNKAQTQRLRVSLEGNRNSIPVRYVAEFDIPRDGQWTQRRLVLESVEVDPRQMESVRLTIDSLSPGRLWVDDVHLHDQFATQAERAGMQGQAFLAIQGLQKDQLQPAARLLQNPWSQWLVRPGVKPWPSSKIAVLRNSEGASSPLEASDLSRFDSKSVGTQNQSTLPHVKRMGESDLPPANAQSPPVLLQSEQTLERSELRQKEVRIGSRPGSKMTKPKESMSDRLRSWLPRPLRF